MQIFSIISSTLIILDSFSDFLYNYPFLIFNSKDEDTAYFTNATNGRLEILFHYQPSDSDEISSNYSEEEINYFNNKFNYHYIVFNFQYKDEIFLDKMLIDFKNLLLKRNPDANNSVLFEHPLKGFISF
ncbi:MULTISPECIES: hypothetical protein [unclassified Chryseobacterium]|uniref:hypothetical protein n=1 Tax=unclassified Chryseobacterium TaxID=2593645 RepID=UPI002269BD0C|nr:MULTISPECIES: hypothetical protein [unclassified Chryseobacterium]